MLRLLVIGQALSIATLALAQTPAAQPSDTVIRINVNLVQVDAVVTDSKDRPVTDLKAADFEVRQDGKVQTISDFSYVDTTSRPAAAASAAKKNANTPPSALAPLTAGQVRRTFAFMVDDLALDPAGVYYVRKAIEKFVDEDMQPGDLVAIVRTVSGAGFLQQFTNDKRILHTAISHILYNGMSRVTTAGYPDTGDGQDAAVADLRSYMMTSGSLGAIHNVIAGLRDMPGRKAIVLFTEDLRILRPGGDTRAQLQFEQLVDSANRASVVISSVDPRGLQYTGLTAADGPMTGMAAANLPGQRSMALWESQEGMVRLAEATGGLFIHNHNDISGAVHRVIEDASGYYLIGYHPAAATFARINGQAARFHNIQLKVKRPGLHVRSRQGFFGNPDPPRRPIARTPQAMLIRAATSPFTSNDIHVRMTGLFMHTSEAGSFVNALLYIDPHDIRFEEAPDDMHKAVLDMVVMTFNEGGQVEDPKEQIHTLTLPAAEYQRYMQDGIVYLLRHPVRKPGGYQMRIAVRDNATLRMGSASQYVEVPNLTRQHLELTAIVLSRATPSASPQGGDSAEGAVQAQDPMNTAALRQFSRGDQLSYACRVLNAHLDPAGKPQLEMEIRIFHDDKQVGSSGVLPVPVTGATDPDHLRTFGAFAIPSDFDPGDYTIQLILTDKLASPKTRVASQWMDFHVK